MSAPARVLMTADAVGGVFSYAVDLCRALRRAGVEVLLAIAGPAPSLAQRRELAAIPGLTHVELGGRLEWMDDPWQDVDATGSRLRELARETRAELVHLNGYAHAALDFGVPTLVMAHSCVLSWWQAVQREPAPPRYAEYRRRVRAGLQAADAVVAPTAAMLSALSAHYGSGFRGLVIPNGADPSRFHPTAQRSGVCAVGRFWDPGKNLAVLVRAGNELTPPLRLVGELTPPGGGQRIDGELSGVTALGSLGRDALAELLARSAIYAHPARYEPFGLSVLEAALSGCALVLADIPSLRELWQGAAHFVDPDDEEQLRAQLARLIADRALCGFWGRRARTRALGYSLSRCAATYVALYAQLGARVWRADAARGELRREGNVRCGSSAFITR